MIHFLSRKKRYPLAICAKQASKFVYDKKSFELLLNLAGKTVTFILKVIILCDSLKSRSGTTMHSYCSNGFTKICR